MKSVRNVRLFAACALLVLFAAAYCAPKNALLSWLLRTQVSPFGIGAAVMIVLALFFGRIFCSFLCPLGTLQELIWRLARRFGMRSAYIKPLGIRYVIPAVVGAGVVMSSPPLITLLDPMSNFGRGMSAAFHFFEGMHITVLALPLALILLASVKGRLFCGWCPVGITLGVLSRFAPFKIRLDSSCASCGICERTCPANCVSSSEKLVQNEGCVLCFSCAASCPRGSVSYGRDPYPSGRREFLKKGALCTYGAGGAVIYLAGRGGTLFGLWGNSAAYDRGLPILPPGAGNISRYRQRCVGCQACVSVCPVKIIKPLPGRVLPILSYDDAYCQFSCVECGKVCPAGAIRELDVQSKRRTRTALSDLKIELCVVITKGTSCGACAESCPTRAVYMKEQGEGLPTIPVFDERYCIGCGACLVVCPAEPKAFVITPVPEQSLTEGIRPTEGGSDIAPLTEFPF